MQQQKAAAAVVADMGCMQHPKSRPRRWRTEMKRNEKKLKHWKMYPEQLEDNNNNNKNKIK